MAKSVNLKGLQFGRLVVVRYLEKSERDYKLNTWLCQCECTKFVQVSTSHLKNGNVKSCGCLLESTKTVDGLSSGPEYSSWHAMVLRCNGYDQNYMDKGRTICDRWLEPNGQGFKNFLADMGGRPDNTTLERVDNSLGYFPENCKWENRSNQCYNRERFKNNTTGRTGVYFRDDLKVPKWFAKMSFEGKSWRLGTFDTFEEACRAREEAELKYYGRMKE